MITIGITTYNRLNTLKRMARSFYESDRPFPYAIRIYDDASTDYDIDTLQDIFPDARSIYRQQENSGADVNTLCMYKDFLQSGDEIFFNADADLLFSKDWFNKGIEALAASDGVVSIFNASSHKTVAKYNHLIKKSDVGAAGTFFRRDILDNIIALQDESADKNIDIEGIDFRFCRLLHTIGVNIYCTIKSYVQHIGFEGYNSKLDNFDYGINFKVDSTLNGQLLNDSLEDIFCRQKPGKKRYALFPFEKIPCGSKVVLYGAGDTGVDYAAQIADSGYCELVAVVDRNAKDMKDVKPIESLLSLDYDYIVLATLRNDFIHTMKQAIVSLDSKLISKVIYKDNSKAIRV